MLKKRQRRPRAVPPIVAAVVQPVSKRLSRMEDLLLEMRHEQDVQMKLIKLIRTQLDALTIRFNVRSSEPR